MHAIHPQLPRAVIVGLAVALTATVLLVALAGRLGDVQLGPSHGAAASSAGAGGAVAVSQATAARPAWLAGPFAPLATPVRSPLSVHVQAR